MTSVQSLLQQLNGNKLKLVPLLILSIYLLSACGGSKDTISDSRVMTPKKRSEPKPFPTKRGNGKVDTIHWTEIDRTKEYNDKIEDLELDKRSSYRVALLYPFGLSRSSDSDINKPNSKVNRAVHYYAGTQMALEQLNDEGINLQIDVYDSESDNFDAKLQQCRNADVIIGPRERGQLATTAQYGKNNEIPVISPWLSSTKVAVENPYYIQLKPSLKAHMVKIVEDVKNNFADEQVFLLGRKTKKDLGMMKFIQEAAAAMNRTGTSKPFQEYYLEEDSLVVGETAYDSIFYEDKTSVFILPNWSFKDDEKFIYNAVRKMSGEKGLNDVVLYGMPILFESEKIKFEHYANLNMRISRTSFLDRTAPEVKEFRQAYFNKYQDFPSEEVFKGYDMMMYVGRNLHNYGKKFQYFLDTYESSLYQTKYDVQKVYTSKSGDRLKDINYLQNDHIYILEFKDNHFIAN